MKLIFTLNGQEYESLISEPHDISIPIRNGAENVNAFYANDPIIKPFELGDFIGAVKNGSPVNTNDISFNPHGNGTHTECLGHITSEMESVNQSVRTYHMPTLLISVTPKIKGEDRIVTKDILSEAIDNTVPESLIIRTMPNDEQKYSQKYSGTNPVYLDVSAMEWIVKQNIKHLLVDFPSVDREQDEGKVLCHKIFWQVDGTPRTDCSITEFVFVRNEIPDGLYLLNLQLAPFENDASPSRPLLFKTAKVTK